MRLTAASNRFSNLLLEILHCNPSLPDPARLMALSTDDWQAFTAEAIRFRMAFQVKTFLDANSQLSGIVPQVCLDQLGERVRKTLMNNLLQQAHLRDMLALLKEEDIPVMLLKGLWLGETVYRDLKARATGDIDLLLRLEEMPRFTKLLVERGFDVPKDTANICDLAPAKNEFPLINPARNSFFDIHWALTLSPIQKPVDEETFWQRSEIYTIAGLPCRSLCVEDHLLYLCFHAADHHRFNYIGPRALLDVACLIAHPPHPIKWDDLVTRARELAWERAVWLMLDLTRVHLGSQVPQSVLNELCPAGGNDQLIHSMAIDAIFLDQPHTHNLHVNIVRLTEERSLLKRAAFFYERLFPASEEIATKFMTSVNSPGIRWLYFKRIGLLIKKHLPKIFLMMFKNVAVMAEKERIKAIDNWMEGDAAHPPIKSYSNRQ